MPKIASLGALSSRGFGEFAQTGPVTYIEDVFSTYLYTGINTDQTIVNGIDLSGKGGLVWYKVRNLGSTNDANQYIVDTVRGRTAVLSANTTNASSTSGALSSFNSNGFTQFTQSSFNYVSWTFRKQPKFFDVVTYTGNGVAGRTVSHNLQSVPGLIIIKRTDISSNWQVLSVVLGQRGFLNATSAFTSASIADFFGNGTSYVAPTSTVFTLGNDPGLNANGSSYVAYLFAHNAGGFGLDGSQNVISCGSFTTNGSGVASITLGYEPQYILVKQTSGAENWYTFDTMRGWNAGSGATDAALNPNLSDAEFLRSEGNPTATGFTYTNGSASSNYIYMAIRRGPMKVPTDATTVFNPIAYTTANASSQVLSVGFPADTILDRERTTTGSFASNWPMASRLTGTGFLRTTQTAAEVTFLDAVNGWDEQNSIDLAGILVGNGNFPAILYAHRRAPSFFDVVCYSGTSATNNIPHNLGVKPELWIVKNRTTTSFWPVWVNGFQTYEYVALDQTSAKFSDGPSNQSFISNATTLTIQTSYSSVNQSGSNYVAYLFASCPGVSKVGSYTGTGATQTISCGFTGGARYVLIKRTDSTGDWWVWDTARGMISGTDPRLAYNSSNAEINANWVYTTTGGFQIVTSDATVNASGGTYIYLAIA